MSSLFVLAWSSMAANQPVGLWLFDDAQQLARATTGNDLTLHGTHAAVSGPRAGDGAVRIGVGSYYECHHGIAPNGGGNTVNSYSLVFDFRVPTISPWYCFFQTNPNNSNDGDCFIRAGSGFIGVGATGYSTKTATPQTWHRLVVAVDNSASVHRLYLDGELILDGTAQGVDGRFALDPIVLLFADDDGEDGTMDVARVALYDNCLTAAEAAELGGVPTWPASDLPPSIDPGAALPATGDTTHPVSCVLSALDPDSSTVRIRLDWGDNTGITPWSSYAPPRTNLNFTHTFAQPGSYLVKAQAQDQEGQTGPWTELGTVQVSGTLVVRMLTSPYLQNVTTNSIRVLWETDVAAPFWGDYGITTNSGNTAVSRRADSGGGTHIYRAEPADLQPATTYQYRVRTEAQTWAGGTFTTAPAGTPDFAFAVWSDSQGHNHGSYGPDPHEPTKAMFRHMSTNNIQIAVTAGDLAENGASYPDTRAFYLDRVARYLNPPWFVAWGNHDGGANAVIRKFSDMPSGRRAGYTSGYGSFSFDYAGCHFVCIDYASSDVDIATWLESDLQAAAMRQPKFSFVFIHVPPFCELWIDGSSTLRSTLVPLLEAYDVDVCFSGHTHEYSRGELNGVFYCITGGGSWLDTPESLVRDWPHMTVGGYHAIPGVVKPSATQGGGLVNEYVKVEVKGDEFTASMLGFAPNGTPLGVLDQFTRKKASQSVRITSIRRVAGGISLEWTGPTGHYALQRNDASTAGAWQDSGLMLNPAQHSVVLTNVESSAFFRLRLSK